MQRALALFGVISSVAMTCFASLVVRTSVTAIANRTYAAPASSLLPRCDAAAADHLSARRFRAASRAVDAFLVQGFIEAGKLCHHLSAVLVAYGLLDQHVMRQKNSHAVNLLVRQGIPKCRQI